MAAVGIYALLMCTFYGGLVLSVVLHIMLLAVVLFFLYRIYQHNLITEYFPIFLFLILHI